VTQASAYLSRRHLLTRPLHAPLISLTSLSTASTQPPCRRTPFVTTDTSSYCQSALDRDIHWSLWEPHILHRLTQSTQDEGTTAVHPIPVHRQPNPRAQYIDHLGYSQATLPATLPGARLSDAVWPLSDTSTGSRTAYGPQQSPSSLRSPALTTTPHAAHKERGIERRCARGP
jgi:hypothetical protein